MVLSDVIETIGEAEKKKVEERKRDMLFVRGDGVVMVSPPLRTS